MHESINKVICKYFNYIVILSANKHLLDTFLIMNYHQPWLHHFADKVILKISTASLHVKQYCSIH